MIERAGFSCANFSACHSVDGHMGALDLKTDPYKALVNVAATQKGAMAQGLVRVVPGSTAKSFLWMKLTLPVANDPTYGFRMPNVTDQTLDDERLKMIEGWIEQGALDN